MSSKTVQRKKSRSPGRPPGATGERTRGEILDAALLAFAEAGFDAMSVRELTRHLNVSHNLVHHHFGTKQELWRAALDYSVGSTAQGLLDLLGGSLGSPDSKRILREGIERGIALLMLRPALVRILVAESARKGPRLNYLYKHYLGPMVEMLARFLAESQVHGVRDVDPRVAALFVLSSISAQSTHGALAEKLGLGSSSEASYTKAIVDLVMGGLLMSDSDPA